MRVPLQSALQVLSAPASRAGLREQVVGYALIATLILLVGFTISLYPR